jgi:hypothetical protein
MDALDGVTASASGPRAVEPPASGPRAPTASAEPKAAAKEHARA